MLTCPQARISCFPSEQTYKLISVDYGTSLAVVKIGVIKLDLGLFRRPAFQFLSKNALPGHMRLSRQFIKGDQVRYHGLKHELLVKGCITSPQ